MVYATFKSFYKAGREHRALKRAIQERALGERTMTQSPSIFDDQTLAPAKSCCKSKARQPSRAEKLDTALKQYQPLIAILAVAIVGGVMTSLLQPASGHHGASGMQIAMGLFLLPLSLLKLFDVQGFATGFRRYDPIAKVIPVYALAYPFIEGALALTFIVGVFLTAASVATVLLFSVSAFGIWQSMAKGEKLHCACVGSKFGIPLGPVSLAENVTMAIMAAFMIVA
jgi:hypothetical protein